MDPYKESFPELEIPDGLSFTPDLGDCFAQDQLPGTAVHHEPETITVRSYSIFDELGFNETLETPEIPRCNVLNAPTLCLEGNGWTETVPGNALKTVPSSSKSNAPARPDRNNDNRPNYEELYSMWKEQEKAVRNLRELLLEEQDLREKMRRKRDTVFREYDELKKDLLNLQGMHRELRLTYDLLQKESSSDKMIIQQLEAKSQGLKYENKDLQLQVRKGNDSEKIKLREQVKEQKRLIKKYEKQIDEKSETIRALKGNIEELKSKPRLNSGATEDELKNVVTKLSADIQSLMKGIHVGRGTAKPKIRTGISDTDSDSRVVRSCPSSTYSNEDESFFDDYATASSGSSIASLSPAYTGPGQDVLNDIFVSKVRRRFSRFNSPAKAASVTSETSTTTDISCTSNDSPDSIREPAFISSEVFCPIMPLSSNVKLPAEPYSANTDSVTSKRSSNGDGLNEIKRTQVSVSEAIPTSCLPAKAVHQSAATNTIDQGSKDINVNLPTAVENYLTVNLDTGPVEKGADCPILSENNNLASLLEYETNESTSKDLAMAKRIVPENSIKLRSLFSPSPAKSLGSPRKRSPTKLKRSPELQNDFSLTDTESSCESDDPEIDKYPSISPKITELFTQVPNIKSPLKSPCHQVVHKSGPQLLIRDDLNLSSDDSTSDDADSLPDMKRYKQMSNEDTCSPGSIKSCPQRISELFESPEKDTTLQDSTNDTETPLKTRRFVEEKDTAHISKSCMRKQSTVSGNITRSLSSMIPHVPCLQSNTVYQVEPGEGKSMSATTSRVPTNMRQRPLPNDSLLTRGNKRSHGILETDTHTDVYKKVRIAHTQLNPTTKIAVVTPKPTFREPTENKSSIKTSLSETPLTTLPQMAKEETSSKALTNIKKPNTKSVVMKKPFTAISKLPEGEMSVRASDSKIKAHIKMPLPRKPLTILPKVSGVKTISEILPNSGRSLSARDKIRNTMDIVAVGSGENICDKKKFELYTQKTIEKLKAEKHLSERCGIPGKPTTLTRDVVPCIPSDSKTANVNVLKTVKVSPKTLNENCNAITSKVGVVRSPQTLGRKSIPIRIYTTDLGTLNTYEDSKSQSIDKVVSSSTLTDIRTKMIPDVSNTEEGAKMNSPGLAIGNVPKTTSHLIGNSRENSLALTVWEDSDRGEVNHSSGELCSLRKEDHCTEDDESDFSPAKVSQCENSPEFGVATNSQCEIPNYEANAGESSITVLTASILANNNTGVQVGQLTNALSCSEEKHSVEGSTIISAHIDMDMPRLVPERKKTQAIEILNCVKMPRLKAEEIPNTDLAFSNTIDSPPPLLRKEVLPEYHVSINDIPIKETFGMVFPECVTPSHEQPQQSRRNGESNTSVATTKHKNPCQKITLLSCMFGYNWRSLSSDHVKNKLIANPSFRSAEAVKPREFAQKVHEVISSSIHSYLLKRTQENNVVHDCVKLCENVMVLMSVLPDVYSRLHKDCVLYFSEEILGDPKNFRFEKNDIVNQLGVCYGIMCREFQIPSYALRMMEICLTKRVKQKHAFAHGITLAFPDLWTCPFEYGSLLERSIILSILYGPLYTTSVYFRNLRSMMVDGCELILPECNYKETLALILVEIKGMELESVIIEGERALVMLFLQCDWNQTRILVQESLDTLLQDYKTGKVTDRILICFLNAVVKACEFTTHRQPNFSIFQFMFDKVHSVVQEKEVRCNGSPLISPPLQSCLSYGTATLWHLIRQRPKPEVDLICYTTEMEAERLKEVDKNKKRLKRRYKKMIKRKEKNSNDGETKANE